MSEHALIVDRKGLAKKLAHRPKAFIVYELLQNAWDENVSVVKVTAEMLPGKAVCEITVEDDAPDGFADLASVFTMFRDSKKAPDPEKRGRFEMGEKLVIALALRATITSTKGTVHFEGDKRKHGTTRTARGTIFQGEFKMTRAEYDDLCCAVSLLAVPPVIATYFNRALLFPRPVVHEFQSTLQTVKSDGEGNLTPTQRKTSVLVYETGEGERGHIFEMGIPVVETGDPWHYDVQQRVPVSWERDNVPPAYLRALRVEALNAMHVRLTPEEAAKPWVTDAMDDERCSQSAIMSVVTERFGEKAVINDPSDPEGTKIAVSEGYTVIPGGAFSKAAWQNIRATKAVLPAGQVTPSPKPYSPDGRPERVIPEADWTAAMRRRAEFSELLFMKLMDEPVTVVIVNEPQAPFSANFGEMLLGYRLCLNLGRLGKAWFEEPNRAERVLDLLLHEFCHHTAKDHLSHEMHETATLLGARLANIALNEPELFR